MDEEPGTETTDPDAQLMVRFKDGDAAAFDFLFRRHMRAIVNYSYRFVRNRDVAEELAQDVFLKVYEGSSSYRPEARFTTWLYRIATNVCLNEIRRPAARATHQSLTAVPDGNAGGPPVQLEDQSIAAPDRALERQALARILGEALGQIPEKQRTAFILNKYQELSYVEVADVMKTSEQAVKSLIHRAKEALAERLQPLMPELLSK